MRIKVESGFALPQVRRAWGQPSAAEERAFRAFIKAYKQAHNCELKLGHFDPESRIQVFNGPTFSEAHTASRCRARITQLNFRKGQ